MSTGGIDLWFTVIGQTTYYDFFKTRGDRCEGDIVNRDFSSSGAVFLCCKKPIY